MKKSDSGNREKDKGLDWMNIITAFIVGLVIASMFWLYFFIPRICEKELRIQDLQKPPGIAGSPSGQEKQKGGGLS